VKFSDESRTFVPEEEEFANMDSRGGRQQRDSRVAVFAFGTRGDVLPVAVVVAALAQAKKNLTITFITHAAHQNLQIHLSEAGVSFISISSPPVVPSPRSEGDYLFGNEITGSSDSPHKKSEEEEGYSLFIVELDTQGQGLSHS
jgi:hypothetical protein